MATTLGVLLLSRTPLPRWVRLGWQVGITLGFVFVCWLNSQSLYVIGALCPYCMVAWAASSRCSGRRRSTASTRRAPRARGAARLVAGLVEYRLLLTVVTYAVVVLLIGQAFWSQWVALV